MITLHDLPPPVIFAHDEILHSICLPPLATFLTELTQPEHLLKLNDILDRFRTPKSYHRIDVRLVDSSELPPGSDGDHHHGELPAHNGSGTKDISRLGDDGSHGDGDGEERVEEIRKREKGEPTILPEGMSMEDYLLQQPPPDLELKTTGLTGSNDGNVDTHHHNPPSPSPVPPITTNDTDAQQNHSDPPANSIVIAPLPPKPITYHPLPPSGPVRRIRELRLDLRTLDNAALFALETWRREILGLEKLDMDHPDSVWYNPPASPSPPPQAIPKKKGRPQKSKSMSQDVNPEIVEIDGAGENNFESLVEALHAHGVPDEDILAVEGGLNGDTITEALNSLTQPLDQDSVPGKDTREVLAGEKEEEAMRSPSPDIILDDLFDTHVDADPDFVPPPEPVARPRKPKPNTNTDPIGSIQDGGSRKKLGRPRKSDSALLLPSSSKGRKARPSLPNVTFDERVVDIDGETMLSGLPTPASTELVTPQHGQWGGTTDQDRVETPIVFDPGLGDSSALPIEIDRSPSPLKKPVPMRKRARAFIEAVVIPVRTPKKKKPRISSPKMVRFAGYEYEEEGEDELSPELEPEPEDSAEEVEEIEDMGLGGSIPEGNRLETEVQLEPEVVAGGAEDEWDFLRQI